MTIESEVVHEPEPPTSLALISRAVERGMGPEELSKLMDLYERMERQKAEIAYNAAMNRVQAKLPRVIRWKANTQTNSKYAPLETVNDTIMPIVTEEGFSLSFTELDNPKSADGWIKLALDISHSGGHTVRRQIEGFTDEAGPKGTKNKTPIQGRTSSITVLKRAAICSAFNVTVADMDNDGNREPEYISETEVEYITKLIEEKNVDLAAFLAWCEGDLEPEERAIDKMPKAKVSIALGYLKRKK